MSGDQETDEVERWLSEEFERPGLEAVETLVRGIHLNKDDWHAMIRLVALQHLRTPQSYFESMARWETTVPDVLNSTTREALARLEEARAAGTKLKPQPEIDANPLAQLIRVKIEPNSDPTTGGAIVLTEVILGRRLWLEWIRHILTGRAARELLKHQWAVWEPAAGDEWPLTDDPSIRLNYYDARRYDFEGGWGKRGSEIMMPVSPRHILYTQVGKPSRRRLSLSAEATRRVQQIIAKRAYRWILGTAPYDWVVHERPRVVDRERFLVEKTMWDRWHEDQINAEAEADSATG